MTIESITTTPAEGGLETVEIARKEKPDVRFEGRLLAAVDSRPVGERRNVRGTADRWTRLELWELPSGRWVAAAIGCSDRQGEIDIGDIEVVTEDEQHLPNVGVTVAPLPRQTQVMDFFGWTRLAKKLADKMGWDIIEVLE